MRTRRDARARRLGGLLLAVVLVVSQASAWFHAVAIAHVACAEHGEAIHGGATSDASGCAGDKLAARTSGTRAAIAAGAVSATSRQRSSAALAQ